VEETPSGSIKLLNPDFKRMRSQFVSNGMDDRSYLYKKLPSTPGVYLIRNKAGQILYIGKAGNLRRRVASYFLRPSNSRIQKLVEQIHLIDHRRTETAIEALILESELIKKYEPPFNIREKDDKSFLFVGITREIFPRVLLIRGNEIDQKGKKWRRVFGPFTSSSSLREALKILRKIFPYSTHESGKRYSRPCFDYQIGLCPGVCVGKISQADYLKNIRNLILFFDGKKKKLLTGLKKEMKEASRSLEFERAEKLQRQIFSLGHIQDVAVISEERRGEEEEGKGLRIEGYDISNISGQAAVGSMVVFVDGKPAPNQYRKFKIRSVEGINDVGMMTEVLERRFRKTPPAGGWPMPQLILIDGGVPQVNAVRRVLRIYGLPIQIVGLAKGRGRKKNDLVGLPPKGISLKILMAVRDEAHRFAVGYHRYLQNKSFLRLG
jgi:excinuclease ABC subunit C